MRAGDIITQKARSGATASLRCEPRPDRAQGAAPSQHAPAFSEWQPAETAPRDGTRIIGWYGDKPIIVRWRSGPSTKRYEKRATVWFWSSGYFRHGEPDCWQPAPNAPAGKVAALHIAEPRRGSGHERGSAAEVCQVALHDEADPTR